MYISDWSSDVCSSDLIRVEDPAARTRDREPVLRRRPQPRRYRRQRPAVLGRQRGERLPRPSAERVQRRGSGGDHDAAGGAAAGASRTPPGARSEEYTSERQALMRISYAVIRLKNK